MNNKEKYYLVKYAIPKIRPKVRPKPSKVLAKPIQVPRDTDVFPIKSKPPSGKQPAAVTNPSGGSKGTSPITGAPKTKRTPKKPVFPKDPPPLWKPGDPIPTAMSPGWADYQRSLSGKRPTGISDDAPPWARSNKRPGSVYDDLDDLEFQRGWAEEGPMSGALRDIYSPSTSSKYNP